MDQSSADGGTGTTGAGTTGFPPRLALNPTVFTTVTGYWKLLVLAISGSIELLAQSPGGLQPGNRLDVHRVPEAEKNRNAICDRA